jgi:hypothetical protein
VLVLDEDCARLDLRGIAEYAGKLRGRPVSTGAVDRWLRVGLRGVRLDHLIIAGVRITTEQAVREFLQKVTDRRYATDSNE